MFGLAIKDFAVNTEHVFAKPVPFGNRDFTAFSERMLEAFSLVLFAKNISLDQGDRLYDYRLSFGMFGGNGDVVLSAFGLTAAFRTGRSKKYLGIIGNSATAIEVMLQGSPVQFRRITFAAHAEFRQADEFEQHMGKITDKSQGCSAGGVILHSSRNDFRGEMRFSIDKSLAYAKGLFVTCEVFTEEVFSADLFSKINARFGVIAGDLGLDFMIDE